MKTLKNVKMWRGRQNEDHETQACLFIYTIFQEGDIFSSTASLPYGPLSI